MVELKDVHQQPEQTEETVAKLDLMDAWTVFDEELAKIFPGLHNILEKWKPTIDVYIKKWESINLEPTKDLILKKYQSIPITYEMIEQQSAILNLIHGLFLMLYGGSWVSLTTFISFCKVYKVYDVLGELMEKKGKELRLIKGSLQQLWLLIMVFYAVWTVPFLSKITVAFMLEKHVSRTIINPSVKPIFEEQFQVEQIFGRWWPLVLKGATRYILAFMSLFFHNIQICLVMACIGYHKLCVACSPALHEQIRAMEGPFKLDGTALTLWASAILCTLWQLWSGYQSSYFGIIVPLGFLIDARKSSETYLNH